MQIKLHYTLLPSLLTLLLLTWATLADLQGFLPTTFLLVASILSVAAHEFGHALVAYVYRLPVVLTLTSFGGAVRVLHQSLSSSRLLLFYLAGPLTNYLLAGISLLLILSLQHTELNQSLNQLLTINLILALFNSLPLLPLDGGQIIQTVVHQLTNTNLQLSATVLIVISTTFIIALPLIALITSNHLLLFVLIAPLISLYTSVDTMHHAIAIDRLKNSSIRPYINRRFTLHPTTTTLTKKRIKQLITTNEPHLISDHGGDMALVSLNAIPALNTNIPLLDYAVTASTALPSEQALAALNTLLRVEPPLLVVIDNGQVLGTISLDDLLKPNRKL